MTHSVSDENSADAQREKAELIEQALLMNLIFSLDAGPEDRTGEAPPPPVSPPPSE